MVKHVIVDGSNIATEGRSKPSLKQLHEAVVAFLEEHPKVAITVIVDATFGHRIDPKEVPAFNKAIEHNELVTPPAGTVGRGDAFVLSIAEKAGAAILSNDSYQEFHGQFKWLFDEGRLIGGKPVPHVGWVFVERIPVRGEKSRMSERASKKASSRGEGVARKASAEASKPMPIPKSPPPGATLPTKKNSATQARVRDKSSAGSSDKNVNEILPFLSFVENHTVGSVVDGVVESYSSHGAYVQIGEIRGYVPLRMLGNPPPRSAREAMKLGDTVTLEIAEIIAGRRSVNLKPAAVSKTKNAGVKKVAAKKVPAKKVAAKANDKNSAVKKPAVKKSDVKKSAVKVTAAKKTTTAKPATGKPVVKKPVVKKAAANKTAVKKVVARKADPVKKAAVKKFSKKSSTK